jgi:dihydroflavonol-4-reductase
MNASLKIALTGTTGHIASAVIPRLLAQGRLVRGLVYRRLPEGFPGPFETVQGSLADQHSLERLVDGCDVVIHCAGRVSIHSNSDPAVYETNVNGTRRLFETARAAGVRRFIHISSIHAYDQYAAGEKLSEESPFCPDHSPQYDRSKRDAQKFVLEQASAFMEVVVLNPTAVIGPYDAQPSFLGKAIIDIYNRKIPVLIRGGFDFVDVRDVAQGIVNAIERGRSGEAYLLGGKWHDLNDLQNAILVVRGDRKRLPVLPSWVGYAGLPFTWMYAKARKREPLYTRESIMALTGGHHHISSDKAIRELGYSPRSLTETITDTIGWFKQTGRLK